MNLATFNNSEKKDQEEEVQGKTFCQYNSMCRHTTDKRMLLKVLVKKTKQKKGETF